jgi:hypothetical protein
MLSLSHDALLDVGLASALAASPTFGGFCTGSTVKTPSKPDRVTT